MVYVGGTVVLVVLVWLTVKLLEVVKEEVWRPFALKRWLEKQGLRGPSYAFMSGSLPEIKRLKKAAKEITMDVHSHNITPRVLPHYCKWSSQYGETFFYWYETQIRVCISDPELAKEILSNKFGFYEKPKPRPTLMALLGKGLVFTEGLDWVKHRRVLNPAFNIENLKAMTKRMAACTESKLDAWLQEVLEDHTEIDVHKEFKELTGDIISHTAFGTSFVQGKEVFEAQKELQRLAIASIADTHLPGHKYLPTRSNIRTWTLKRKLRNTLGRIIESRTISKSKTEYGNDLLGLMIEASATQPGHKKASLRLNMEEIMDECKTFFFAGHETTANLLTWTVFLLSLYPDWQNKLREEVLGECGTQVPDADRLSKLKSVNMVLLEALRLYCPVIAMFRRASKDITLGNLMIPKDTAISIPVAMIHRDKKYWGEDANEFNPLRFSDGSARAAKHPNALMAFSIGPRACIGQNFAMIEAKMIIAMILQRLSFTLSPKYQHAPADKLTLQPEHGLPIIFKPLHV